MKSIEYCILTDEKEFIEYEKNLYYVYSKKDPEGWVFNNYKKINERLIPLIEYSNTIMYALKKNNKIIAGITFNCSIDKMQLEMMGFNIDHEKNKYKICEGLNLFVLDDLFDNIFEVTGNLLSYAIKDLKNKQFEIIYGTCEEKVKAFYNLLGWDILDECIKLGNVNEYLLKNDLQYEY